MVGGTGAFCGGGGSAWAQGLHERRQEKNIPNMKKNLGHSRTCQEASGAGAQGTAGCSQQLGQSTAGQGEKFDFFSKCDEKPLKAFRRLTDRFLCVSLKKQTGQAPKPTGGFSK